MRVPFFALAAFVATAPLAAHAADLTAAQIQDMTLGKTLYMNFEANTTAGQGAGFIYYPDAKSVILKTPTGAIWHGVRTVKGDTVCIEWKEQPNTGCTRFDKTGDVMTLIRIDTNKPRGTVTKVVAGNPERL